FRENRFRAFLSRRSVDPIGAYQGCGLDSFGGGNSGALRLSGRDVHARAARYAGNLATHSVPLVSVVRYHSQVSGAGIFGVEPRRVFAVFGSGGTRVVGTVPRPGRPALPANRGGASLAAYVVCGDRDRAGLLPFSFPARERVEPGRGAVHRV